VIGYRKIQGDPVKPGERYTNGLADELARFLAALHAVPVKRARGLGLSAVAGRDGYRGTWARTEPLLRERLSRGQYAGVAEWWDGFIADDSLFQYTPAVVHTDIWQENVLVDEAGHLAGVLDFDHIGIGDPAQDIAALGHLGSEFASAAREAYAKVAPWGNELERRAHTLWDFRALEEVDWAIEMGRDQAIAEAVARLSRMLAR
jgi:aminoglycoside phosphotransferase (APT) family kinase protein